MLLDLRPLQSGETSVISFEQTFDISSLSPDISSGSATASGSIANHSGYMLLTASVTVSADAICARCASHFAYRDSMVMKAPVAVSLENEDDEYLIAENGILDLEAELYAFVSLELPGRFLCKSDCKGLCPVCGHDLNVSPCGCKPDGRDPRWSALEGYFDEK